MSRRFMQSLKRALLALVCLFSTFTSNAQLDYLIGTGTNTGSAFSMPAPFYDYFEGDRQQYLFLASELTAAGMGPGIITAVKWNTTALNGIITGVPGYTVTMGTTTASTLTSWQPGITFPVYGPGTYTVLLGMNAFTLATPFVWNGVDNIVVQVCHGTGTGCRGWTANASVNYTNTSFNSTYYYNTDCAGSQCAQTTGYTLTSRPNTIFTYGMPCTGMPSGYTVNGPSEVCPGKPFKVGLSGSYLSNLTYEWEYSDNSTAFQPFTGTVSLSGEINDVITAPRWYRCKITCTNSGLSYMTPVYRIGIAPFYYCYCDVAPTSNLGLDIGNIKVINTGKGDTVLNNGNATPALSNSSANKTYSNFQYSPNKPVVLYRDNGINNFRILISSINSTATFTPGNVAVFIDYDRNGTFDAGEKVFSERIDAGSLIPYTETGTFTVPGTAKIGLTGMRVVLSNSNVDSCGFGMSQGEVEDYLADIRYEPCKAGGNAGAVASTENALCPGYDYITTNSGYETTKSELNRVWQVSGDNIVWSTIPNSGNKDTLMRIFSGQPLYYKVRMICEPTKDTTYSTVVKVDARPSYKCYCYSQAIGGNPKNSTNPLDSSDIGGIVFTTFNTNSGGAHLQNPAAQEKRTDHTDNPPLLLDVDSTYQLTVYHTQRTSVHADAKITVFMDFDNDKEYETPYERVYTGYTSVGNFTVVNNITIPSKVITGIPTGMRIILNNDISPNIPSDEACGPYTSGETEDLMVIFRKQFPANVSNIGGIEDFGLFPNPTTGKFRLQFSNAAALNDVTINITNITGQTVMQKVVKHNGGTFTQDIDMSNQARGVYVVELRTAEGAKQVQRLVID